MDKSQSDTGRPLVVIAERDEVRGDDLSFVSLLVPFYRRRFALTALWLVLVTASVAVFPTPSISKRWFFTVAFESAPEIEGQGQGQGLDGVAGLLAGLVSTFDAAEVAKAKLTVDWSRLGSGSKAELLRGQLNISAQNDSDDVPVSVATLHAAATSWATDQTSAWRDFRVAAEAALLARAGSLSGDATTTADVQQAAETVLANVRAAAATPPRWVVSAISSTELPAAGIGKTWGLRIGSSIAVAIAVIGFVIGWSTVASAARVQSST